MRRGSTPTQRFSVGMDLRGAEKVYVTYSQAGANVIERTNDESMTIDSTSITFKLTQDETLKLHPGTVEIQIKFKLADGTVGYSKIMHVPAERVLKDEVI